MDTHATAQIDRIVERVRDVLGADAIGAYLHGSTALDELQPHNDLDVLVVSGRATTPDEKRTLIRRLLRLSGRGDPSGTARSIELTIVVASEVVPWRFPPKMDLQYGDWWRKEFEAGDIGPWESPNPDLAVVISMVRGADRPMFGPRPAELLDPVPQADLERAVVEGIPGLLADLDSDTTNVVLTFARIWITLATGEVRSKNQAAQWALERLPPDARPVLARAHAVYLGHEEDQWDDLRESVRPHVDLVLGEIERLRNTASS